MHTKILYMYKISAYIIFNTFLIYIRKALKISLYMCVYIYIYIYIRKALKNI